MPRHNGKTATLAAGDALRGQPGCQPYVPGQLNGRPPSNLKIWSLACQQLPGISQS